MRKKKFFNKIHPFLFYIPYLEKVIILYFLYSAYP